MSTLRVLFVIESSSGGVARHVIDMAKGMSARGVQMSLVYSPGRACTSFKDALPACNFKHIEVLPIEHKVDFRDLIAAARLSLLIAKHGPFDIIHAHSSKAGGCVRLAAVGGAVRVYTPHAFRSMDPTLSPKRRWFFSNIERFLGRYRTDSIVTVSREEYRHAASLGLPMGKVHIVPNGIQAPDFNHREKVRATLGLADDDVVVGFVGRFVYQKAPERIVDSFAQVAEVNQRLHLLLVGDGPGEEMIKRRLSEYRMQRRCTIAHSTDAAMLMPAMDLLAMPSRYEGMAYVLIEALFAGIPVIATRVGGVEETVVDGENGFVVENTDDPGALSKKLRLLVNDKELRGQFGKLARKRASLFSYENMLNGTMKIYQNVYGQERTATNAYLRQNRTAR